MNQKTTEAETPEIKVFGKEGAGEKTFLQKGLSPALWALAPEYADQVFESYRAAQMPPENPASPPKASRDLPAPDYAGQLTEIEDGVAVIHIDGPLDRQSRVSWYSGQIYSLGQDAILAALEAALANPAVRAILLSINSPGGVVAGTKELADFIADARAKKPLAAYVNGLAASAAFWLAAATGRIYAPRTAMLGSIGVIMAIANLSGFYQKLGVQLEYISSGKFKSAGRGERELTDEEREYFQRQITAMHEIFKSDVRAHLDIARPDGDWAEAQMFLADEAFDLGLLAGIARDEQGAIAKLKEELMPEKITLEYLEANAPDLLAQIRAEAAAQKEEPETGEAAKADTSGVALAVIRAVCPHDRLEAATKMFDIAARLGLNGEDAEALFTALRTMPPWADAFKSVAELRAAYMDSLNADLPKPAKSPLLAEAERRAQKEKTC